MPLVQIKMGDRGKSPMIKRSDVAGGTKGRAVLLDPNPRCAVVAYDEDQKMTFYADQETVIKYKLRGNVYYLLLIARLNTDMKGDVIGDDFVVEYLRLADKEYAKVADAMEEQECNSILLTKEVKGEYSYVIATVSKKGVPNEIISKLQDLDLEPLWSMVEADVARPIESYLIAIGEMAKPVAGQRQPNRQLQSGSNAAAIGGQAKTAAPKKTALVAPKEVEDVEFEEADEFATEEDEAFQ